MSDGGLPQLPAPRLLRHSAEGATYILTFVRYDAHVEASHSLGRATAHAVLESSVSGAPICLRDVDGGEVEVDLFPWRAVVTAPADVIDRVEHGWMYDASSIFRIEAGDALARVRVRER